MTLMSSPVSASLLLAVSGPGVGSGNSLPAPSYKLTSCLSPLSSYPETYLIHCALYERIVLKTSLMGS